MASYPQKILPFILHRRELIVVTVLVFRVVEQLDVIKYVSESPRFPPRSFGLGSLTGLTAVIVFLSFRWRNVADGLEQGVLIEPGDPLQRCQLHRLGAFPGATAMDQLRFVESVDRLGQGVVVAVALAADRRFDARLGESLGVADGHVLGGFNRSSQHLLTGGLYGAIRRVAKAGDRSRDNALAWRTLALP